MKNPDLQAEEVAQTNQIDEADWQPVKAKEALESKSWDKSMRI